MTVVIDCSFVARALVPSQQTQWATDALEEIVESADQIVAPDFLQIEFASMLRRLESRGMIRTNVSGAALDALQAMEVTYVWNARWVDSALAIARTIGVSRIYDSIYLACALDLGVRLHTCDARFASAASADFGSSLFLLSPPA